MKKLPTLIALLFASASMAAFAAQPPDGVKASAKPLDPPDGVSTPGGSKPIGPVDGVKASANPAEPPDGARAKARPAKAKAPKKVAAPKVKAPKKLKLPK